MANSALSLPSGPAGTNGTSVPQAYMRYSGIAARGSTNTLIPRWSTLMESDGAHISIVQSATNGDYFTVDTNGCYGIFVNLYNTGGAFEAQIMVGSTLNNSNVGTETQLRRVKLYNTNQYDGMDWGGYVFTTDKIYLTIGAPNNTAPLLNQISIMRFS